MRRLTSEAGMVGTGCSLIPGERVPLISQAGASTGIQAALGSRAQA